MEYRRLYRSRDACIAGICAGFAERYDFDALAVRIFAVLLTVVTFGLASIGYVILWRVLPLEAEGPRLYDVQPERAESAAYGSVVYESGEPRRLPWDGSRSSNLGGLSILARLAIAASLMILFLVVAMNVSPMVSGTHWWEFWPIALIIAGLFLIIIPIRSDFEALWHALGIMLTSVAAAMLPMSLGVISWATFGRAVIALWPLLAVAVVLLVVGLYREDDVLVVVSSFFVAAFCLLALFLFPVPGQFESIMVLMPNGKSYLLAIGVAP